MRVEIQLPCCAEHSPQLQATLAQQLAGHPPKAVEKEADSTPDGGPTLDDSLAVLQGCFRTCSKSHKTPWPLLVLLNVRWLAHWENLGLVDLLTPRLGLF